MLSFIAGLLIGGVIGYGIRIRVIRDGSDE